MGWSDPVAVIEAAWRVDLDEDRWLRGIVEAASYLDYGHGVFGYVFDVRDPSLGTRSRAHHLLGPSPQRLQSSLRMQASSDGATFRRLYWEVGGCATLSEALGDAIRGPLGEPFQRYVAGIGAGELIGVVGLDPSGQGVLLVTDLDGPAWLLPEAKRAGRRLAAHLAAAWRLRKRRDAQVGLLRPGAPIADRLLARAVGRLERARALRQADPLAALEAWRPMAGGRYTLVPQEDGYAVHENAPSLPGAPGLDPVVVLAAQHWPDDLVAYALDLSLGAVRTRRRAGQRALGVRGQAALCRRLHP